MKLINIHKWLVEARRQRKHSTTIDEMAKSNLRDFSKLIMQPEDEEALQAFKFLLAN